MPAVTNPPGELMYMYTGFSGASASKNNSWAVTSEAMLSLTSPWTHMIRSRRRREKMSKDRSPWVPDSSTTGTRPTCDMGDVLMHR